MKKRFLAFCMLAAFAAGSAAHADTLADIKANHVIKVAIDLGNPPFGLKNQQLEPDGFDVHTAQLLAKDLGVKLEIVPQPRPTIRSVRGHGYRLIA